MVLTRKVYDYLLSFSQEVELVWGSAWSITKVLFFVTRYGPFIDMPVTLWRKYKNICLQFVPSHIFLLADQWGSEMSVETCLFVYRFSTCTR